MFAEVGILSFIVKKRHGVASEFSSSFKNIISSLWTLHLCVAKFLQHLPMGISQLIPHSWACGSYHDLLDRKKAANGEVIEPRVSSEHVTFITSKDLRSPRLLGKSLRNICVTDDDHVYVPSVTVAIPPYFSFSRLISGLKESNTMGGSSRAERNSVQFRSTWVHHLFLWSFHLLSLCSIFCAVYCLSFELCLLITLLLSWNTFFYRR